MLLEMDKTWMSGRLILDRGLIVRTLSPNSCAHGMGGRGVELLAFGTSRGK